MIGLVLMRRGEVRGAGDNDVLLRLADENREEGPQRLGPGLKGNCRSIHTPVKIRMKRKCFRLHAVTRFSKWHAKHAHDRDFSICY